MRCSVIDPASAFRIQLCSFYAGRPDFKIACLYRHCIVGIRFIICGQHIQIGIYSFIAVCSSVAYFSKISCCNQLAYRSAKVWIRLVKVFPVVIHSNCHWFCSNLNRYIVCCQICISRSGCFYTDCLHAVRYIFYARRFCGPVCIPRLIVYGITFRSCYHCGCFMRCSVIDPASAFRIQLCSFYAGRPDFKIACLYRHCIVGVRFIICGQYIRIGIYRLIVVCSSIAYFSKISCCYQLAYRSAKVRIRLVKIFPVVIHSDCHWLCSNLNRNILSCQICISGSGCFYTDRLYAVCYICHAWSLI